MGWGDAASAIVEVVAVATAKKTKFEVSNERDRFGAFVEYYDCCELGFKTPSKSSTFPFARHKYERVVDVLSLR